MRAAYRAAETASRPLWGEVANSDRSLGPPMPGGNFTQCHIDRSEAEYLEKR